MRNTIAGVILIFSSVVYTLLFVALCHPRLPGDVDLILVAGATYFVPGLCLLFLTRNKRKSPHPSPLPEGEGIIKNS